MRRAVKYSLTGAIPPPTPPPGDESWWPWARANGYTWWDQIPWAMWGTACLLLMTLACPSWAGDLPDPVLTPGAIRAVTMAQVCIKGSSGKARNVPNSVKRQVYKAYGIVNAAPGEYEVDHLISLELGGSNDIKNLWPQSYITTPWNAHLKDKLETRLHALVCRGMLTLEEAQKAISSNWIAAYQKYFGGN